MFIPKLIYNDGAAEGGGAATADVVDKPSESANNSEAAASAEVPKAFITEEEAKEFGFDSKEAMVNFIRKQKEVSKPDEDKQKEAELDNANFRKYAIENGLAKEADFKNFQTLSEKQDYDLVFESHLAEFKEDNPEITDPAELIQEAKADFEKTYKLNSDNAKAKERATAKIAKAATELRNPVNTVIDKAKEGYNREKEIRANLPEFEKYIHGKVKQYTPEKAIMYKVKDGEEDVNVEIELSEADRKAMAKDFANHKNYTEYAKGDKAKLETALDKKMQAWVKVNKFDEIAKKTFEVAFERGKSKGSNKGADNPFPLVKAGGNEKSTSTKSADEEIRESHNRAAGKYIK